MQLYLMLLQRFLLCFVGSNCPGGLATQGLQRPHVYCMTIVYSDLNYYICVKEYTQYKVKWLGPVLRFVAHQDPFL